MTAEHNSCEYLVRIDIAASQRSGPTIRKELCEAGLDVALVTIENGSETRPVFNVDPTETTVEAPDSAMHGTVRMRLLIPAAESKGS